MGLRNQTRDHLNSCGSGKDGVARLEFADFELNFIRFRFADVGRIGDDEIERTIPEPGKQVGFAELNATFELMAGSVGARDFECGGGDIGRVDFGLRQLFGQSQRDAARAGADVDNSAGGILRPASDTRASAVRGAERRTPGAGRRGVQFQHSFDDMLGLGAWNQNRRRDDEIHAPEFLVASDVLRGNAVGALSECGVVSSFLIDCEFALGMRVEVGAVTAQREH